VCAVLVFNTNVYSRPNQALTTFGILISQLSCVERQYVTIGNNMGFQNNHLIYKRHFS
jgi:hypothetical protein